MLHTFQSLDDARSALAAPAVAVLGVPVATLTRAGLAALDAASKHPERLQEAALEAAADLLLGAPSACLDIGVRNSRTGSPATITLRPDYFTWGRE